MKKILLSIILTSALCISACTAANNKDTMFIRGPDFSKETRQILDILGKNAYFFDYSADDTVHSFTFRFYFVKDNEWIEGEPISLNVIDKEKRIGVIVTEYDYTAYLINEDGHSSYSWQMENTFSNFTNGGYIIALIDIILDKEQTLLLQVSTKEDMLDNNKFDNFKEVDCTSGYAVTITFSDQKVKE